MDEMRRAFEAWVTAEPMEWGVYRWGDHCAHPGNYCDDNAQCAWEAWQAACAAEREACAATCEDRAEKFESAAQRADARGEHDDAALCRATAWQMEICAKRIRARSQQ